jgi:cell pole-organizing protein PopZ
MSQSRSDPGQSMEEILASIRRIIADGEREAQESGSRRPEPAPAAPAETAPESTATETSASDILVLTEMVQDDGSVVSLQAETAPASPIGDSTGSVTLPPRPMEKVEGPAAAPTMPGQTAPAGEDTSQLQGAELSFAVELAPSSRSAAVPGPDERFGGKPLQSSPLMPASKEEERITVPAEGYKKTDLVSEEAVAASTAALAQLAQSVTRTREPTPGQSKTVDELVREAVEPMLKQWLDANLSRIVERMVREAIDRVVGGVESPGASGAAGRRRGGRRNPRGRPTDTRATP